MYYSLEQNYFRAKTFYESEFVARNRFNLITSYLHIVSECSMTVQTTTATRVQGPSCPPPSAPRQGLLPGPGVAMNTWPDSSSKLIINSTPSSCMS